MAVARLHVIGRRAPGTSSVPWCPVPDRIGLLSRPAAERYQAEGNPVGARFLAGWDAFDRHGPARPGVGRGSGGRPEPLVDRARRSAADDAPRRPEAVERRLAGRRHRADRLADGEPGPGGGRAGWFLVSNVAQLPEEPEMVLDRYRTSVDAVAADVGLDAGIGDWEAQVDLAFVIGLLLRGWRKGLDAEAGLVLPTGVTAADDLGWWCDRALEAARGTARRL